ncbi:MAG: glycerophosphodiester phosphodiesterase [Sphingomonadaceae bacterium]|nr:glycerophosphodiester phosphodiesterase [Sphingomonadaceae bacterium]
MRSLPSARPEAFLLDRPFAHRGLHGPGVPENSGAAFAAAVARGHGIECDVRLSGDGEAIVFHDADAERLTGTPGRIAEMGMAEIVALRLADGSPIPTLAALLDRVTGAVPLLIELKAPHRIVAPLCLAVRRALCGYAGPHAVMSFNPEVGHWFARHAPRTRRGLVVTEEGRHDLRGRIERRLALARSRAQFLAYDVRALPSSFASAQLMRGMPLLGWTVRDAAALAAIRVAGAQPIYEEAGGWTLPA